MERVNSYNPRACTGQPGQRFELWGTVPTVPCSHVIINVATTEIKWVNRVKRPHQAWLCKYAILQRSCHSRTMSTGSLQHSRHSTIDHANVVSMTVGNHVTEAAHNRRQIFPVNHLHCYWQPRWNNKKTCKKHNTSYWKTKQKTLKYDPRINCNGSPVGHSPMSELVTAVQCTF